MSEQEKTIDYGVKTFMVGNQPMELKFTAATRFRLFKDLPIEEIQGYVTTEAFKMQATALLLLGKDSMGKTVEAILDEFENLGLLDHEMMAIYEWVLERTINFMLKEAEAAAKQIRQAIPQVKELSNTLNTSQA
ncbi:hypothetical protein [Acinetobacter phage vB_AbaS_TCUP2199]|nr:hypothetical protein [Acinetobacter phage vB_AbaS_TCUP2199]